MKQITKCINCGSSVKFNPHKEMLCCDHCDSTYPISASKNAKLIRKYESDYTPQNNFNQSVFFCNTCKSTHSVQTDKISTRCPSCGATTLVKSQNETNTPDGIIPFKFAKDKASEIFFNWLHKRKLAPKNLIVMARNKKISSVYVPIYNLNGVAVSRYVATVKKVHTDSSTDTIFSTVHTLRDVETLPIKNSVMSANSVVDSDLIDKICKIEPSDIVPYSLDYLFGYCAANTNISIQQAVENLNKSCINTGENIVRHKLKEKYDEIVHLHAETSLQNLTFSHLYFPVFMNHYSYKGKNYHCYINGITGEVVGKSPKSIGKIMAIAGSILAAIAAGVIAVLICI